MDVPIDSRRLYRVYQLNPKSQTLWTLAIYAHLIGDAWAERAEHLYGAVSESRMGPLVSSDRRNVDIQPVDRDSGPA